MIRILGIALSVLAGILIGIAGVSYSTYLGQNYYVDYQTLITGVIGSLIAFILGLIGYFKAIQSDLDAKQERLNEESVALSSLQWEIWDAYQFAEAIKHAKYDVLNLDIVKQTQKTAFIDKSNHYLIQPLLDDARKTENHYNHIENLILYSELRMPNDLKICFHRHRSRVKAAFKNLKLYFQHVRAGRRLPDHLKKEISNEIFPTHQIFSSISALYKIYQEEKKRVEKALTNYE